MNNIQTTIAHHDENITRINREIEKKVAILRSYVKAPLVLSRDILPIANDIARLEAEASISIGIRRALIEIRDL